MQFLGPIENGMKAPDALAKKNDYKIIHDMTICEMYGQNNEQFSVWKENHFSVSILALQED